jgi:hypothetical protein
MPRAGFILILNVGGVTGDVLLGGDSLGRGECCGPTEKWLRENLVEPVRLAAIVGDILAMNFASLCSFVRARYGIRSGRRCQPVQFRS